MTPRRHPTREEGELWTGSNSFVAEGTESLTTIADSGSSKSS
jgi:hypothetical protein